VNSRADGRGKGHRQINALRTRLLYTVSGLTHVPSEAKEVVQRINGALAAVIRSMTLHGGARSLLLDQFTAADDRIPWPERAKEARAAAAAVHARKEAEPTST
jgi:hypothetical protein